MTRAATFLIAAAAVLAAAAPAHAGSYDVVACGAPGAGGVNQSWTPLTSSYRPEIDPAPYYDFDTTCAGGLVARSLGVDGTRAPWLTSAAWVFDAPGGTTITKLTAWRYGEARDDRAETSSDDGDHWQVRLLDETGNAVGGNLGPDACSHGAGSPMCTIGSTAGMAGPSVTHDVATHRLAYTIGCGGTITDGCQTSYGGYPLGSMVLYGAVVTVSDSSAPAATVGGSLTGDGWKPAGGTVDWSASDNVGIRRVRLLLDGGEVDRDQLTCDFTRRIPCPASTSGSLGLGAAAGTVTDGAHTLSVLAEDTAGNVQRVDRSVSIDAHAPAVGRVRVSGRTVAVPVTDTASGVVSGTIETRSAPAAPWTALSTAIRDGKLVATVPTGSLRGKGIRVTVADQAGNGISGQATAFRLTSRVAGRKAHAVRGGRIAVPFGKSVALSGRLVTLDGVAIGGTTVSIAVRSHRAGSAFAGKSAPVTDASGRLKASFARGVARIARLAIGAGGDLLPQATDVLVGVKATSTIHASRTRLFGPGTVRFSGRLRTAGAAVPPSGKIVELQGFAAGRWRTFATARARGTKARWHASNHFSGRPGSYPVRVRIRRESAFPFELGTSRSVRVRVG
jgi:hypothetical protein